MEKNKKGISLGIQIFISSFVPIILVSIVFIFIFLSNFNTSAMNNLRGNSTSTNQKIASVLSSNLVPSMYMINNLSGVIPEIDDDEILLSTLKNVHNLQDVDTTIYYGTKDFRNGGIGRYVDSSDWDPPEDWIPVQRDWYKSAVANRGKVILTDPYVDTMTEDICVTVAKAVEINGQIEGVVAADLYINDFASTIKKLKGDAPSKTYAITRDGLYVTADDINDIMEKNFFDSCEFDISLLSQSVGVEVKNGKYLSFAPITGTPFMLVTYGDTSEYTNQFSKLLLRTIAIIFILFLFVFAITLLVSRRLRIIFKQLVERCALMASGDFRKGDFPDYYTTREADALAKGFDQLASNMSELATGILDSTRSLNDTISSLNESSSEINLNSQEAAVSINQMTQILAEEQKSIEDENHAVSVIVNEAETLKQEIQIQSDILEESNKNIENIVSQIGRVGNTTITASAHVENLVQATTENKTKLEASVQEILEVKSESVALQEMNSVISAVAEQTNLLAMNAAIEAAHAGEAGKGFAVVADEIRKLAETTATQANESSTQLAAIQNRIASIAVSSELVSNSFANTLDKVSELEKIIQTLNEVANEQNAQAKIVSASLDQIRSSSEKVKKSTDSITNRTEDAFTICNSLSQMSDQTNVGLRKCQEAAGNLRQRAEIISSETGSAKAKVEDLAVSASEFKV